MELNKLDSNQLQIEKLVKEISSIITSTIKQKNKITIALSGGKSPIPVLEKLSEQDIDFTKVTFTLVDDRLTPTDNPDSNENLLFKHLFINNAKHASFISLYGHDNLNNNERIDKANRAIKEIDLAILGMGEDGHTASIFPDCDELDTALDLTNSNKYIITHPKSAKYARISLTLNAILDIPNLFLSINGKNKLRILEQAAIKDNKNLPISYIISRAPYLQTFYSE